MSPKNYSPGATRTCSSTLETLNLLMGFIGIYFLAISAFWITGKIDSSLFLWQSCSFSVFILSILHLKDQPIKYAILYIAAYQITLSFLLRWVFWIEYGTLFDPNAVDALLYSKIATDAQNESFSSSLEILKSYFNDDLSDYGFPIFLKYVYLLSGGSQQGNIVLVILNSVFQTITAFLLYKISRRVTKEDRLSKLIMMLWGLNSASIFFNISGLKEPLFSMLCTLSIWLIYKVKDRGLIRNHLFALLGIATLWLFRNYISLFYFFVYLGYIHFPKIINKYFLWVIISAIILCIFFAAVLVDYFPEVYYSILRNDRFYSSKSIVYRVTSYLLAFIAPIPRFYDLTYPKELYIHSLSLIKYLFSGFAIWGSWGIIKRSQTEFYPLILISLFTGLLLIVSGHMIEYRYAYITMPSFYILMLYGFRYCSRKILFSYWFFALIIIIMFNLGSY